MVYLGPMPDDARTPLGLRIRPHTIAISNFFAADTPEQRLKALESIRASLSPRIRVHDHDGLHVYYDQGVFLPLMLIHAASYIEMRYPDGRAEVEKGGFGPTAVQSRELAPKNAIDRLSEDDDSVVQSGEPAPKSAIDRLLEYDDWV